VVATQDWHPRDHGSFASQQAGVNVGESFLLDGLMQTAWPDHCIEGTHGAEFSSKLNVARIDKVVRKGTNPNFDSYSGFFDNGHRQSTGLHDHLKEVGATGLSVLGLATDYCVKFTVLDALSLGYPVRVIIDGCRGVELNAGDTSAAIESMRHAGAEIIGGSLA
jgi:nicotinamidase/pyrazinamidase